MHYSEKRATDLTPFRVKNIIDWLKKTNRTGVRNSLKRMFCNEDFFDFFSAADVILLPGTRKIRANALIVALFPPTYVPVSVPCRCQRSSTSGNDTSVEIPRSEFISFKLRKGRPRQFAAVCG